MKQSPQIGELTLTIFGSGRSGRHNGSEIKLRCDAAAWRDNFALLLSVIGSESSVKALSAALHSDRRIEIGVRGEDANGDTKSCYRLIQHSDGYKMHRAPLGIYGLWHLVAVAKVDGFLPVLTEDTIWQHLQTEQYTTPLLREWVPWLSREMRTRKMLVENTGFNCATAGVCCDDAALDKLIGEGIRGKHLAIAGQKHKRTTGTGRLDDIEGLDGYMMRFGGMLAQQAELSTEPLHVPGRDEVNLPDLVRDPFEAQAHVIAATAKALDRQKAVMVVAEMGVGKTLISAAAAHKHARGQNYRALVFCPGQLVYKWARELEDTLPGVIVHVIESWRDVVALDRRQKPMGAEWYVIARDKAKLGSTWQAASMPRSRMPQAHLLCPGCGQIVVDEKDNPLSFGTLSKRRTRCTRVLKVDRYNVTHVAGKTISQPVYVPHEGCGESLWQMNSDLWRYAPARYIKRRLKGFFDYLILDEQHQEKSAESAQGNAAGSLIAACKKVIGLTGTLAGGYAWHLKHLLFRMSAKSLVDEGIAWAGDTTFNERYGRIETTVHETTRGGGGDDNRMSHGSTSRRQTKAVRPGVMPALFGRHLLSKAVFLSLSEVADNLPAFEEVCIPVQMDEETQGEYTKVEMALRDEMAEMLRRNDRRLLGTFLQTLLAYPDYPFEWGSVGYYDKGEFVCVVNPTNLDPSIIRPKEQALLDLCLREKAIGRQVWVFVQFTNAHDTQGRTERILTEAGLKVGVLRQSVPIEKREAWIAKNAPGFDVVISHPKLVETGLDLFDKGGKHNFPTLAFFQIGYDLFALRQASRRSWRIGQKRPCKVCYFFYEGTMQARAMALMGKKLAASQALEGKFSTDGLVAMGGDEGSMETALARSLVHRMDEGDVRRVWAKVGSAPASSAPEPELHPLSGFDLRSEMRRRKILVRDLAAALGISAKAVTKARANGVPDGAPWMKAFDGFPLPMPKPTRKRSVLMKCAAVLGWLCLLMLGEAGRG